MVLTLMIPIRRAYHLENVITLKHVDNVCKLLLTTGLLVQYSYACEWYLAWYSGEFRQAGDQLRLESGVFLVLALGFVWLRPPRVSHPPHE